MAKWKSRNMLVTTLLFQLIVCAAVLFDVPVAGQVVGFVYFTFILGVVTIKLLRLDELDGLEAVLFSVGFGVAFLTLTGLLINEFLPLFGVSKPLSPMPLMVVFGSFVIIGGVLVYLRSDDVRLFEAGSLGLHPSVLLFVVLPILGVLGAMWVNAYENNLILLFLIIAISVLSVAGVISDKFLPPRLYPFAVMMTAMSLLYHSSLVSRYIWGTDIHMEYFVFKTVENSAHWSSAFMYPWNVLYGRLNSMLSITILPATYANLLNMDASWVMKILYPLIFSFVPLGLYQLWKKSIGEKRAFMAAFLFMVQNTFYTEMLGLNRQMVGELFFVLLLLVVLSKEMKPFSKMVCFVIFSVALITSHYALAENFLFLVSLVWIALSAMKRPIRKLALSGVVFFFVAMFTWYLYTSDSAVFDSLVSFADFVYGQLDQVFNPASREPEVLRGLGLEAPPTMWNIFSRAFAYITEFLIVVGFVGLVTKRVRIRLDSEHHMFTVMAMVFLGALIVVPGLSGTMNITRFYHLLLFFLAPLCALGAEVLVELTFKRRREPWASILLLIVLVPYFLSQTGFVYEITGTESFAVPLSKYRMDRLTLSRFVLYVDEASAFGAQWISRSIDADHMQVYADVFSRSGILQSYGMMHPDDINTLSNATKVSANGVVYLSQLNVIYGKIVSMDGTVWNSNEFSSIFDNMSLVYTNGGSQVYTSISGGRE